MRNRKWMMTGFALFMTVPLALAGCGGSGGGKQAEGAISPGATKTSSEPIKLTLWGAVPSENGPQEVVDNWNKQHPDVQVEYVRFVNDDAGNLKLDTALISNQPVDMYVNYDFSLYEKRIKAGNALDLGKFSDYNVDDKMGEGAALWKVDDKYYGLPTQKACLLSG